MASIECQEIGQTITRTDCLHIAAHTLWCHSANIHTCHWTWLFSCDVCEMIYRASIANAEDTFTFPSRPIPRRIRFVERPHLALFVNYFRGVYVTNGLDFVVVFLLSQPERRVVFYAGGMLCYLWKGYFCAFTDVVVPAQLFLGEFWLGSSVFILQDILKPTSGNAGRIYDVTKGV